MSNWQIGKNTLRYLRYVRNILGMLVALYLLPALVLRLPSMQRQAGKWVSAALSDVLGSTVTVDRVGLSLWHRLQVDNVYLVGAGADTILRADRLQLGVSTITSLLSGRIHIGAAQLFGVELSVVEELETGRLNIDPILRALASDDQPSSLVLDIGTVILRDVDIRYHRGAEEFVHITELGARLGRISVAPERFSLVLDELKGKMSNGIELRELSVQLSGGNDGMLLEKITVQLPRSLIKIPVLKLNTQAQGGNVIDSLVLENLELHPSDLVPLAPELIRLLPDTPLRGQAKLWRVSPNELLGKVDLNQKAVLHLNSRTAVCTDSLGRVELLALQTDSLKVESPWLAALPHILSPQTPESLKILERLGTLSYRGGVEWQQNQSHTIRLAGELSSLQGRIMTKSEFTLLPNGDISRLSAELNAADFDLSSLCSVPFPIQSITTSGHIDAEYHSIQEAWSLVGAISVPQLKAENYIYRDLALQLKSLSTGQYQISLSSQDPNAKLRADLSAYWQDQKLSDMKGSIKVEGINLGHLGLEPLALNRHFSGEIHAYLSTLNLNEGSGVLKVPRFEMIQERDTLLLNDIEMSLQGNKDARRIQLSAPWLTFSLEGSYNPLDLPERILHSIYRHIPILRSIPPQRTNQSHTNEAQLNLHIDKLPLHLDKLLPLPINLHKPLNLNGIYNEATDRIFVSVSADSLELAQHQLGRTRVILDDNVLALSGNVNLLAGGVLQGFRIKLSSQADELHLNCDFGRDEGGQENGIINLDALLYSTSETVNSLQDVQAELKLYPSRLRIHSALWQLQPAKLALNYRRFVVDELKLYTEGRSLSLSGALGTSSDKLHARLKNINLRYILESAGVDFTMIETDLTGLARASLYDGVLYADAQVTSPHFHLNGRDAASIDVGLNWNSRDMKLNLHGTVHQDSIGGRAKVNGHIKLDTPAGIDLHFDAKDFGVGFTHVFMSDFLSSLDAVASGNIRLFGRFERGVTLEGDAAIKQGSFGLGILGTKYSLSDTIRFEHNRIIFDKVRLTDFDRGTALLNGYVRHDHFGDFDIQLRGEKINNLCVLDTRDNRSLPVYGVAYTSGTVSLSGDDKHLTLQLDVKGEERTDVTLDFNTVQVGKQLGIMRFKRLSERVPDSILGGISDSLPLAIGMKFNIDVTPEAKVGMIMGYDASGGELRGRAMGRLSILVPEQGEASIYGGLDILEGIYTFRLEQLAQKRLSISEGGEIIFRGPIDNTQLDLKAVYSLTANIADLDEDLVFDTKRTNIPVHCILGLAGSIVRPNVRFAIELPGADIELERRVRSLLNTDDAVMRQMLYLIALGKFYTLDSFSRNSQSAANNITSVASSAISEQLSYLLGGLSESITIGTNIKTRNTTFDDTDVELLFSGSLFDDRLLVSANVGYHDNPYLNSTYIGEFDLEYKLNRSGALRLKGYNHYNHMYQYLRQGLTTQGFGLLFRQRFDKFSDLFAPGRKRLYPNKVVQTTTLKP